MKKWKNCYMPIIVILLALVFNGCGEVVPTETAGVSVSGYRVGISAIYGGTSLSSDGASEATIRVEVWDDTTGLFIDVVPVTLSVVLGTLDSASLTTSSGVATTTFTAGTVPGNASVSATVENVTVTATIILAKFVK